jgi:thioredoxin 1
MIERAAIVIAIGILGWIAYRALTRRQVSQAVQAASLDPLLQSATLAIPTIVYFTSPSCAPCRLQQTPVLNRLQAEMGPDGLRLIKVDCTEDPDAATRWGVISVPTVFVLDQGGKPRSVFNGVVGLERLKQELLAS